MSTGEVNSEGMDDVERRRCLCKLRSVEPLWAVDVGGARASADAAGGSRSKSPVPDEAAEDKGILG